MKSKKGCTSINGGRWWGTDKKSSQARSLSQICMYYVRPIPFSCKDGACERASERGGARVSACVCTGGIVTGCVPRRAALGPLLNILWYSLRAGLLGACRGSLSLVRTRLSYTHAVNLLSLVVLSLLPGPWVWGGRDSTVDSTVTIRVRLR